MGLFEKEYSKMYGENSNSSSGSGLKQWIRLGIVSALVLIFAVVMFSVTKRIQIPAGHEAVLIDKPFWTMFGEGGMRQEPLQTGSKWLFYTTEDVLYDVRPVQHMEKFDDEKDGTITADNIPIDFNAYIKVRPVPGKTPKLHSSFGPQWYQSNLKEVFRTSVRDEVGKAKMTALTTRQLNAEGKEIIGEMQRLVLAEMREFVKVKGIDAEVMEVIIGKATPPQKILEALAETASQQQRFKTETEKARAEGEREKAETARAHADNAYRNSIGYTPSQFLQLEMAKKQVEAAHACASKGNCTTIVGQLGGTTATINVK